jgi:hypothetical protein
MDFFAVNTHRRHLARFLARYELLKKILDIEGSIIECGVFNGQGVFTWAKLSSIFEPYALKRKIIGFDTFEGFPHINEKDITPINKIQIDDFNPEINIEKQMEYVNKYDEERYLNQFKKIELIKGDAIKTIPEYMKNNEHIIVSLLFLDFDLYEPTKIALETFTDRMFKGSIIAFDQINNEGWPGETLSLLESRIDLNRHKISKFHFDSNISYIQL